MTRLLDLGLRLAAFLYLVFQFLIVGLALLPAALMVRVFWNLGSIPLLALAFGLGYLVFGITYLILIVAIKHLVFFRSREGSYPFMSAYARIPSCSITTLWSITSSTRSGCWSQKYAPML